jgi:putative transposase
MSRAERRAMVERENSALPVSQQCRLLAVSRSAVYRKPAEVSLEDLAMMGLVDRQYLARPYYGSRRMAAWLATQGHVANRKRVQRLTRRLGLVAIYQRPNTSKPAAAHRIYPYLQSNRQNDQFETKCLRRAHGSDRTDGGAQLRFQSGLRLTRLRPWSMPWFGLCRASSSAWRCLIVINRSQRTTRPSPDYTPGGRRAS